MRNQTISAAKASNGVANATSKSDPTAKSKPQEVAQHPSEPKRTSAPHSLAPKNPLKNSTAAPKVSTDKQTSKVAESSHTASPVKSQQSDVKPTSESNPDTPLKSQKKNTEHNYDGVEEIVPYQPPPPLDRSPRNILIRALIDTMKPIIDHPIRPYTPLIIDPSGRIDIFFTYAGEYNGIFVEAKKYLVEVLIKKTMTLHEAFEDLRRIVVAALKHGRALVFRMTDSATDFRKRFCDPTRFPADLLLQQGGRLFASNESLYMRVVRPEDMDYGTFVVRDGFFVVVTSQFEVEDYAEFLQPSLPMDEMIPIVIQPVPEPNEASRPRSGFEGYSA